MLCKSSTKHNVLRILRDTVNLMYNTTTYYN